MTDQDKPATIVVPAAMITHVWNDFLRKTQKIVKHTKPWTPWALVHLLEIDDSNSAVPAEIILYKAFRGKGRTGIGQRDTVVQVQSIKSFVFTFGLI